MGLRFEGWTKVRRTPMEKIDYAPILRQLRSTLGKLEVALGAIEEAIVWTDGDGRVQWCNAAFDRLVGQPHFRILGARLPLLLPLRHQGTLLSEPSHPWRLATIGGSARGIFEFGEPGARRWLKISASRVELEKPASIVVTVDEVTEETESKERVRRLVKQRQLLLDSAGEGVYGLDKEGRTTFVNPAAARMLGWTAQELIGQPQHDVIHHSRSDGSPYPAEQCPIYSAIREGRTRTVHDEVFWRRDGTSFAVEYTSTPIREGEEISGAVVVFRDCTERRAAQEDALRKNSLFQLLQQITEAANEARSIEQVMQFALDRICSHTGWPLGHVYLTGEGEPGELLPTNIWNQNAPPRFEPFRMVTEATTFKLGRGLPGRVVATNQPNLLAELALDPDFSRVETAQQVGITSAFAFPVSVSAEVTAVLEFFSEEPAPLDAFFLGIMAQIGRQLGEVIQRIRAEERLRQSNRELEIFASVASHDLQEPLRKITAFGDRLEKHGREALDEKGRRYLSRMTAAATRMQALIDDLLTFARVGARARTPESLDLNRLVTEVESDLEAAIEETGASIEVSELPLVSGDPVQMRQLFQNLIGNSLKFRHADRKLQISVSGRIVTRQIGQVCEIEISDNGIGFEPQYAERIFEVFGRLHGRAEYAGTGMGLAICRKIVERHGGEISARSQPGQGAQFTIQLPLKISLGKEGPRRESQ